MVGPMVQLLEGRVFLSRAPINLVGEFSGTERVRHFVTPYVIRIDAESADGQVSGAVLVGDNPGSGFAFTGTLKGRTLKFSYAQFSAFVTGRAQLTGRPGHTPLHLRGNATGISQSVRTMFRFDTVQPRQ